MKSSLTSLAKSLDTRKLPLPPKGEGGGEGLSREQKRLLESATKPRAPQNSNKLAPKKPTLANDARRKYPRGGLRVGVRLSLAEDPKRTFEATLQTINLSVGGIFLESSFFLKLGTRLLATLHLPEGGREVSMKGEVARVDTGAEGPSGFALRFTEYLDGSQVALATHFLSPVLHEFLTQYAQEHRFTPSAEYLAHTADVLAAWELQKGGDVWASMGTR